MNILPIAIYPTDSVFNHITSTTFVKSAVKFPQSSSEFRTPIVSIHGLVLDRHNISQLVLEWSGDFFAR